MFVWCKSCRKYSGTLPCSDCGKSNFDESKILNYTTKNIPLDKLYLLTYEERESITMQRDSEQRTSEAVK